MQCVVCSKEFEGKRNTAKFCSGACRMKEKRKLASQGDEVSVTKPDLASQNEGISVTSKPLSVTKEIVSVTEDVTLTPQDVTLTSEERIQNLDPHRELSRLTSASTGLEIKDKVIYVCIHCGGRKTSPAPFCAYCSTEEKRAKMDLENEEIVAQMPKREPVQSEFVPNWKKFKRKEDAFAAILSALIECPGAKNSTILFRNQLIQL